MHSSHRQPKKSSRFRWLILLPAICFGFADRAAAESYSLECREIEVEWSSDPVWLCQRYWTADGSRITNEQRKSVNVIVVNTLILGTTLRKNR
jgi:hypothetical protein